MERVAPAPGPEILQIQGRPQLSLDGQMSRWWLKSADERLVLQLQENFFGFNWRRIASRGGPSDYPGYDSLKHDFDRHLQTLREWHRQNGTSLPSPVAVELLYDDIIEIQPTQERPKLSDFLSFWDYERDEAMFGWNAGWLEGIGNAHPQQGRVMRFAAMQAGIPEGEALIPVIRLTFTAMGVVETFEDIDVFLADAHLHIRKRFIEVVTETVRRGWGGEK